MRRTRAIAGWLPAVLLVPAAVAAGVVATVPGDDLAAMRVEQPLDVCTTWVFEASDHGAPSGSDTSQVIGTVSMFGDGAGLTPAAQVRRTYSDYPGVGPRSWDAYLAVHGPTLLQ